MSITVIHVVKVEQDIEIVDTRAPGGVQNSGLGVDPDEAAVVIIVHDDAGVPVVGHPV